MAGLDQSIDGTDVAISGGLSAASPLLFGAGVGAKEGAKALMKGAGKGLTQEAAEDVVKKSDRGLIERGWDYGKQSIFPNVGAIFSGRSAQSIRDMATHLDDIDETAKAGNLVEVAENFQNALRGDMATVRGEIGSQLDSDIKAAGGSVDLTNAKAILQRRIEELKGFEKEADTPVLRAQIAKAENLKNGLLGLAGDTGQAMDGTTLNMIPAPTQVADQVSPSTAWKLQQDVKKVADVAGIGEGVGTRLADGTPVDESMLKNTALDVYRELNDQLDTATEGLSTKGKQAYSDYKKIEKALDIAFKDPKKTLQTLRTLDAQSQLVVMEALKRADEMGVKAAKDARKNMAIMQWVDAPWLPISTNGTTSTSRSIPAALAGGALGFYAGANSGMGQGAATVGTLAGGAAGTMLGGPGAIKNYVRLARAAEKNAKKVIPRQQVLVPATQVGAKGVWDYVKRDQ